MTEGLLEAEATLSNAPAEQAWMLQAKCRGIDPEVFFPTDGSGSDAARRICAECPVRAECLEYAIVNKIEMGVWGGASQRERRRIWRRRRNPVPETT